MAAASAGPYDSTGAPIERRVVVSTQLTEADTHKLAELDIRDAAGRLTDSRERLLWKALKAGGSPVRARSLGVRVVGGHAYKTFAAAQLNANASVPLSKDVLLAQINSGADVKTLLTGVSDTSAGASSQASRAAMWRNRSAGCESWT
jgi:hypothetical protein